jgi:hypothetical protein
MGRGGRTEAPPIVPGLLILLGVDGASEHAPPYHDDSQLDLLGDVRLKDGGRGDETLGLDQVLGLDAVGEERLHLPGLGILANHPGQ